MTHRHDLEKLNDDLNADLVRERAAAETLRRTNDQLQRQLADANENATKLGTAINEQRQEIGQLQRQLADAKASVNPVNPELLEEVIHRNLISPEVQQWFHNPTQDAMRQATRRLLADITQL